ISRASANSGSSPSRPPPPEQRVEPVETSPSLTHQLPEVIRRRHFELVVRARLRVAVRAPALEDPRVAQPPALHLVVPDLEHALRSQFDERGVLRGAEPGALLVALDRVALGIPHHERLELVD